MRRYLILTFVLFNLLSTYYNFVQGYVLPYDNAPITTKTWEEIDIAWNNPYDENRPNTAKLLRPIRYANKHNLVYGDTNVRLNLTEFGVLQEGVYVTAVKSLTSMQINAIKYQTKKQKPLIGLYQHEVNNVRTYTFQDREGNTSMIHATPSHLFYVVGTGYVSLNKITNKMHLRDMNGAIISLICQHGKTKHCGVPYNNGKKIWVYNVEVYQHHHYFIGNQSILAHNNCLADTYNGDGDFIGSGNDGTVINSDEEPGYLFKILHKETDMKNLESEASLFKRYYGEDSAKVVYLNKQQKYAVMMQKIPGVTPDFDDFSENELTYLRSNLISSLEARGIAHFDLDKSNLLYLPGDGSNDMGVFLPIDFNPRTAHPLELKDAATATSGMIFSVVSSDPMTTEFVERFQSELKNGPKDWLPKQFPKIFGSF